MRRPTPAPSGNATSTQPTIATTVQRTQPCISVCLPSRSKGPREPRPFAARSKITRSSESAGSSRRARRQFRTGGSISNPGRSILDRYRMSAARDRSAERGECVSLDGGRRMGSNAQTTLAGTGVVARLSADAELERLYAIHSRRVLAYCRRQLGGRGEAEDAMQTVFLHALRRLRSGVVLQAESAWLFTIAHNVCRSYWRSSFRRRRAEEQRDPQVLQEVASDRETDHDELFGLDDALSRIPEAQRRALLLREWHGLPYREIAERMGTTQTAVEMLLFRARRSLAAELRGERTLDLRPPATGFGELLANLKIVLGGSTAAKIAATGAVVAVVSAGGSGLLERHRPTAVHSRPAAKMPPAERVSASGGSPARAAAHAAQRRAHITAGRRRGEPARAAAFPVTARPRPALAPISSGTASSSGQRPPAPAAPGFLPAEPAPSPTSAPAPADSSHDKPQAPAPDLPTAPDVPPAAPAPPVPAPEVPDVPPLPPAPELPQVPGVPSPALP